MSDTTPLCHDESLVEPIDSVIRTNSAARLRYIGHETDRMSRSRTALQYQQVTMR